MKPKKQMTPFLRLNWSELQPRVRVAALGTRGDRGAGPFGVKVVAADAMKGDLAALGVVERAVAPIVIEPQETKETQHQQAVEGDIEREIGRRDHNQSSHEETKEPRGKNL